MATTYEPIATASINATDFSFTSIPQTYTDLRVVFVGTNSSGGYNFNFYTNNSNTYWSSTNLIGNGTTASSTNTTNFLGYINLGNFSTTVPGLWTIDIFSYTNATIKKTFLCSRSADRNGSGDTRYTVGLNSDNTAAITRIDFNTPTGNMVGTATLYGIKAA